MSPHPAVRPAVPRPAALYLFLHYAIRPDAELTGAEVFASRVRSLRRRQLGFKWREREGDPGWHLNPPTQQKTARGLAEQGRKEKWLIRLALRTIVLSESRIVLVGRPNARLEGRVGKSELLEFKT